MTENPYLQSLIAQNNLVNKSLIFAGDNVTKIIEEIEELEYLNINYNYPNFTELMAQKLKELEMALHKLELEIAESGKWKQKLQNI